MENPAMTGNKSGGDPDRRLKVGLALGSGSARGLSHLGVIRAIQDAGVDVDFVAGASIGALIGAIQAAGQPSEAEAKVLG